jgi:LysR family transcriptional regulator, glycine cleavage system transcriptional activator
MSVDLARLASLDLVRGFVAVGRRMSITLAAQDLCLTQSAVSRQVRALEALLGVRLLVRGHRLVAFTPEGARLFATADVAVRQLQDVIGAIRIGAGSRPVTITTSIGVAGLWLLPRLGGFLQRHPGIDVRIAASSRLTDPRQDGPDLAIRYCAPDAAPQGATRLFGETVAPVAHPSLGLTALDGRQGIEALTLLEFDGDARPWLQWENCLASQGWHGVRARGVLRFNQYDQMIHAAIAGQGVALGRLELLGGALADGRLRVVRMPAPLPAAPSAYWLVRPEGPSRSEIDEVARWIVTEAKQADTWPIA